MSQDDKIRKMLNISIQSKKYNETINKIVNNWSKKNLEISTKVCDSIILKDNLDNSVTLSVIISVYELIKKIVSNNCINQDEAKIRKKVESILSQVININNSKMMLLLTTLDDENNKGRDVFNPIDMNINNSNNDINGIYFNNNNISEPNRNNKIKEENKEFNEDNNIVPLDFFENS